MNIIEPESCLARINLPQFHSFLARWHQAISENDYPTQTMAFAAMANHARSILSFTDPSWRHHSPFGQDTLILEYMGDALKAYQGATIHPIKEGTILRPLFPKR